jgi:hypothetical protein
MTIMHWEGDMNEREIRKWRLSKSGKGEREKDMDIGQIV